MKFLFYLNVIYIFTIKIHLDKNNKALFLAKKYKHDKIVESLNRKNKIEYFIELNYKITVE